MRLILVRHGETDWNQQHRLQGLGDLGLNETGRRQAEALAQALKNERVEAIYTSPLKRAWETSCAIGRFHQVEVATLDELKELDAGEVDGLTYEEMRSQHGDLFTKWMTDAAAVRLPGGGTLVELQNQAWAAIREILRRQHGGMVEEGENKKGVTVVVAHFFTILCIICKALGLNLSHFRRLRLDVAATCTLDFNRQKAVLTSLNETCHLAGEVRDRESEKGKEIQ